MDKKDDAREGYRKMFVNSKDNLVPLQSLSLQDQRKYIAVYGDPYEPQHKGISAAFENHLGKENPEDVSGGACTPQPLRKPGINRKKQNRSGCGCALHLREFCPSNDNRIGRICQDLLDRVNRQRAITGGRAFPKNRVCKATLDHIKYQQEAPGNSPDRLYNT